MIMQILYSPGLEGGEKQFCNLAGLHCEESHLLPNALAAPSLTILGRHSRFRVQFGSITKPYNGFPKASLGASP